MSGESKNAVRVEPDVAVVRLYIGKESRVLSDKQAADLIRQIRQIQARNVSESVAKLLAGLYEEDWNVGCVVEAFAKNPHGFEQFCANLFRNMGYNVYITPPTRDGGYDLEIWSSEKHHSIVECKCFSEDHPVGRPLLQRLVGAGRVKENPGLVYITTSSFTSEASEYALKCGITLLDGEDLVVLLRRFSS